MRLGRLILPHIVFAAVAGIIAFQMTHQPRSVEAAGALLTMPAASCATGASTASVTFKWSPFAGETQWLDVSTTEHFAPDTFKGHGPMPNDVTTLKVDGLPANTVHYWRVNTLGPVGWTTSDTGIFVACGAPRLLWGPTTCEGRFLAQVNFRWAPSADGINAQYIDVGTDPGFAPGSFLAKAQGVGVNAYLWRGLQANTLTWFRINALGGDGVWRTSETGGFHAECAPPVREGIIGSGDRLMINRLGINAPVNIRDVDAGGHLGDPIGPLDVVRYTFPLYGGFASYPGQGGTTLIAGHVDFRNYGLAVFAPLRRAAAGDVIEYLREDGILVTYQVAWVDDLPPDYNFGDMVRNTGTDTLVLITCNGEFDWTIQRYSHRRVVYATKIQPVQQ